MSGSRSSTEGIQESLFGSAALAGSSVFHEICQDLGVPFGPGWPDAFGEALRARAASIIRRPLRAISLFTGAGGLDIGFHDAGFDIVEMVEINDSYAETLKLNAQHNGYFESGRVIKGDVNDYEGPKDNLGISILIGGPPCQTFSAAGRRAAGVAGTKDQRGNLFEQYIRILSHIRPHAFVFENVYGITGAEAGEPWERITEAFGSHGYSISWRVLDAADFGVPQHRERVFIVGIEGETFRFPRPTHGPDSPGKVPYYTASLAIENIDVEMDSPDLAVNGKYADLLSSIPPGLNYSFFTEKMGHPRPIFAWRSKFSDFLYKADPDLPVRTIKAFLGKYTGPFHWESRRFAIEELKRLQTFPNDYRIVGTRNLIQQQIGNSVPPQLARILAISVLEQAFGVTLSKTVPTLTAGEKLGFRQRKRATAGDYKRKAADAISALELPVRPRINLESRFTCDIDASFRFKIAPQGLPCRIVTRENSNILHISASISQETQRNAFRIELRPRENGAWPLSSSTVVLVGDRRNRLCYVCVWKALEALLRENSIKDDLVQLGGYYAYEPTFVSQITYPIETRSPLWKVVAKVVSGECTREVMTSENMARQFSVSESELANLLLQLRDLGYEVRSHQTNVQIPPGSYLIPYVFPTFTERSVQLHKSLL